MAEDIARARGKRDDLAGFAEEVSRCRLVVRNLG